MDRKNKLKVNFRILDLKVVDKKFCKEGKRAYYKTVYEAPDGTRGTYTYFVWEAKRGKLHGCRQQF